MAGSINEDYGGPSMEALAEWRSSEQVENGTPSTSPPYWDTDDDDDDCGAKPSELYGKFTWKVENFSQISKRELRSNAFEVGGYKWYILIYPQGCDVSNHLSLFLCVANHDKLLPGWSHFAQFTICVANKDPKKSKYSDTLHRFWKKEHDWGWKKFMELSKVLDGFINEDSLVIKAQVQVIREKADHPFRCLDCFYRRELVRVYLTNVEQICRRFVEERRSKLVKLIEDKARWLSFCDFWSEIDQNTRRRMTREKTDAILRVVVKHFFVEKEVTSTLVMDSLYSGLRALECQSKSTKATAKLVGAEETKAPIVCIEKDMFVLTEDVLVLLERASLEILPPKDEKGPQNRTKDGNSGDDINKDSIERDERRLTELGCRTIEIFVLAHIFSNKIEVAHQEAVALKKQEELIREEEAAGQAENEHKTKRGTTEKEKRAKKKQSKQRRSSRKVKDKKDEKSYISIQDKQQETTPTDFGTAIDLALNQTDTLPEKSETVDDVSNATDTGDDVSEMLQHESEDRDASIVSWDTDASEIQLVVDTSCNGVSSIPVENKQAEKKSTSVVDDNSSTCSTDSALSVVVNGNYKEDPPSSHKSQASPSRGKKQFYKETHDHTVWEHGTDLGHKNDSKRSCVVTASESESVLTLKDRITLLEQHLDDKQEDVPPEKKLNVKDMVDAERPSKQMMAAEELCSLSTPTRNRESNMQPKPVLEGTPLAKPVSVSETFSNSLQKTVKAIPSRIVSTHIPAVSKSNVQHAAAPSNCTSSCTEKPTSYRGPVMSRPSSAPIVPDPRPSVPFVSMVQTAPSLARSASAAGRLGPDPSAATHCYVSSSYRNAIMGKTMGVNPSAFIPCPPSSINPNPICSQPSSLMVSSPMLSPQSIFNRDQGVSKPGFTFGSVTREVLNSRPPSTGESSQLFSSIHSSPSVLSGIRNLDIYGTPNRGSRAYSNPEPPASMSGSHAQGRLAEDFPHLDIINSLFDEEQNIGRVANGSNNGHHHQLTRQYSFPGDVAMPADMVHGINCCRLDQPTCYYNDAVHGAYGSSYGPYDGSRNAVQGGMPAFTNGQIDRVMQNQWPSSLSHVSLHGMRNTAGVLYQYQRPEYSNLGSGGKSYTMFPPTSGN